MARLPKPPVPAHVDLRDFHFMPLDVVRLMNSETWGLADGWAAKAAVTLWARAWHQVPAASLPDNDGLLAKWADVPDWDAVRGIALRGFVRCSDGRLYHSTIAEKALEAWEKKEQGADKRETHRRRMREWREQKSERKQRTRDTSRDIPRDNHVTSLNRQGIDNGEPRIDREVSTMPRARARGSPPPKTWPPEIYDFASKEGFADEAIERELARLADWAASNGTVKRDWVATARNWFRRAAEQTNGGGLQGRAERREPDSILAAGARVAARGTRDGQDWP